MSAYPPFPRHRKEPYKCCFGDAETLSLSNKVQGAKQQKRSCTSNKFLLCGTCACHAACYHCVIGIYNKATQQERATDPWLQFVGGNLNRLAKESITIPIGHCCEHRTTTLPPTPHQCSSVSKQIPNLSPVKKTTTKSKGKRYRRRKAKKISTMRKKENKALPKGATAMKYSGYMHFHGSRLLLSSPMCGDIDIHGAGDFVTKDTFEKIQGAPHCVLSTATCIRAATNAISAKPFSQLQKLPDVSVNVITVAIDNGYSKKIITAEIITIPIIMPSKQQLKAIKGINDLSDDVIKGCYAFNRGDERKDVDCTIIQGAPSNLTDEHPKILLLFRWHHLKDFTSEFAETFYDAKMKLDPVTLQPGKGGYEVRRTGGSSGLTTCPRQDRLLEFLHRNDSATPRRASALKIVQDRDKYVIYYIGVRSAVRHVARVVYTPAQIGGAFPLSNLEFVSSPFLQHFAECKVNSALVLQQLQLVSSGNDTAKHSVWKELEHWDISRWVGLGIEDMEKRRRVMLSLYNTFNRHSMVAYNVGYHVDIFDNGMPSLENKAVFKLKKYSNPPRDPSLPDICRGGGEYVGDFCFAILDWGADKRHRRNVALDMEIIQAHERVTQRRIDEWLIQHPEQNQAYYDALNYNN